MPFLSIDLRMHLRSWRMSLAGSLLQLPVVNQEESLLRAKDYGDEWINSKPTRESSSEPT
jgi:hypothetical protein